MSGLPTTVCPLRSGSSGNAVFVRSEKTRLLLDAGVSCKAIEQALHALNEDPCQLTALLVTHEHTDHIAGVGVLMRRYRCPLYVNQKTWAAMKRQIGPIDEDLVHFLEPGQAQTIGSVSVNSFSIPHDAVDPVGLRLQTQDGDVALLTDLGHLDDQLLDHVNGCALVLIEANYDPTMLESSLYPEHLKERISSSVGHLSNEACAQAVSRLLLTGTKHFILSHLSAENNPPDLALLTVGRHLNEIEAEPGEDVQLSVARRCSVSQPICL